MQIICGQEYIDVNGLEDSVSYDDGYDKDTPIIKYLIN